MAKDTKMIRVVSRGYVSTSRGRVMTPLMSPYRESVNRIWNMLTVDRADINEKLDDGSFIRLTIHNYDKDNSVKADVATGIPHKVTKSEPTPEPVKVEEPKVEEVAQKVEPEVEEKTEETNNGYSSNSYKKNRKRNKNRQNNNTETTEEPVVEEPEVEEKTESESIAVEAEEVQ